ncbi:MAG: hypothetical protein ACYC99_01920 [Candidatus Geothermincolia bacterium]
MNWIDFKNESSPVGRSWTSAKPLSVKRMSVISRNVLPALSLALLLVISLVPVSSAAAVFSNNVQLTGATGTNDQGFPEIAVDSTGASHVTWAGADPFAGAPQQIWYADNTSGAWSAPTQLTAAIGANDQSYPKIEVDSNGASHVTWYGYDPTAGAPQQIWYADNTSGAWSAPAQLTVATGANDQRFPEIAVDSTGASHVTWYGADPGGTHQIWYADNTSGAWPAPTQLTGAIGANEQANPKIAVDQTGASHLTWVGPDPLVGGPDQIWYADNTSGAWTAPAQLTAAIGVNDQSRPQIAVGSNGAANVTWYGADPTVGGAVQIWYASDAAGSWPAPTRITGATGGNNQGNTQIAVDSNGGSHLTWDGYNPTTGEGIQIWYSDNTSGAWSAPVALTTATGGATQVSPRIAVGANGSSHITWYGYTSTPGVPQQIWYADNTSGAWAAPTQLTNATGSSSQTNSMIAIGPDGASHLTWAGADPAAGGASQIWYNAAVAPTVTGISPSTGTRGQSSLPVTITGSKFQSGATLTLTGPDTIGPVSTTGSGDTLHATLNLVGKNTGSYKATVTNPDLITATKTGAFTVNAPTPAGQSTWYLAEGTTAWGFECWISIINPNTSTVNCLITYMPSEGGNVTQSVSLPANSRATVYPRERLGAKDFSTKVQCTDTTKTIAVDRTMMWTGSTATTPEAHSSVGVTSPAETWYLPEGSTAWGFECWLLIQNPNPTGASCTVTYMLEGGSTVVKTKDVPANSRKTFNVADDIGARDASIKVESAKPVIPERAMYRNNRREGHDSIGTTSSARSYYLAEGTTGYGFTTYVLIQNPNATSNQVTVTYMTNSGPKPQAAFSMEPNSRKTIRVNDVEGMVATDFSTQVTGTGNVIAERAMYWDNGTGEAAHDSIGMNTPHKTFYLPDGQAGSDVETFTLVQNPGLTQVNITVTYLLPSGAPVSFTDAVAANSRKTFNMADKGIGGQAGIVVTCTSTGKKIMVERAMYYVNRGAGTDTIGGFSD